MVGDAGFDAMGLTLQAGAVLAATPAEPDLLLRTREQGHSLARR
ncbi:MAG: hypothetical protein ABWX92_08965 [Mycetocola sp.]